MNIGKSNALLLFILLNSCSNGSKEVRILRDDVRKTITEIETRKFGTGGGITGTGPGLVKMSLRKYDSLNNLFYESYKETSFIGCSGSTEKWKVTAKISFENINVLELTKEGTVNLTFKNRNGRIDSMTTISYADLHNVEWLDPNDW